MKDLLSKEQYCFKIHTTNEEKSLHPTPIDNPLYGLSPIFTRGDPFYDFSKISNHLKIRGSSHYDTILTKPLHETIKMN